MNHSWVNCKWLPLVDKKTNFLLRINLRKPKLSCENARKKYDLFRINLERFTISPLYNFFPVAEWLYLDLARRIQTIQCRSAEQLCPPWISPTRTCIHSKRHINHGHLHLQIRVFEREIDGSPVQFIQVHDVRAVYIVLVVDISEKSTAGSVSHFLQWIMPIGRLHQILLQPPERIIHFYCFRKKSSRQNAVAYFS